MYLSDRVWKQTCHRFAEFLLIWLSPLRTCCIGHFQTQWPSRPHPFLLFVISMRSLCTFLGSKRRFCRCPRVEGFFQWGFLHPQWSDRGEWYRQCQVSRLPRRRFSTLLSLACIFWSWRCWLKWCFPHSCTFCKTHFWTFLSRWHSGWWWYCPLDCTQWSRPSQRLDCSRLASTWLKCTWWVL